MLSSRDHRILRLLSKREYTTAASLAEELEIGEVSDGIMVARGARGNPWIFRELNHYFHTGEKLPRPTAEEVCEMILRHAEDQIAIKGEYIGIREMRKHVAWYTAGMRHSAGIRRESNNISSYEELKKLTDMVLER